MTKMKRKLATASLLAGMFLALVLPIPIVHAAEVVSHNRTILTVDSNQTTTLGRYHKLYLTTDGDNRNYAYFKAQGYFPEDSDSTIKWVSNDPSVASVSSPSGAGNTVIAIGSGSTQIKVTANDATVTLDVNVKSKEEVKQRVVELAKELPDDYDSLTMSDAVIVEELYDWMMSSLNTSERTALGKVAGNEKFATVNSYYYRAAMKSLIICYTSTNVELTNGADYTSLKDCIQQLELDKEYLMTEQKHSLQALSEEIAAADPATMNEESVSGYSSKLGTIRANLKSYIKSLITSLPVSDQITLEDEDAILTARYAYTMCIPGDKEGEGGLTETATTKLIPAENALKALKSVVEPQSITIEPAEVTLAVGANKSLTATITPDTVSDASVQWSSDKHDIATVDENGRVKAVSQGEATITATTVNGKTATTKVTVSGDAVKVENITLAEGTDLQLTKGNAKQITATVEPDTATDQDVSWVSSDPETVSVDQAGNLIAIAVGKADITVTSQEKDSTVSATCHVTVKDRETATEPNVYFQHKDGRIQEMDAATKTFTLEQSDQGNFCLEGSDKTPYWYAKGDTNTTNNYIVNVYRGSGQTIFNDVGETSVWAVEAGELVDSSTGNHLMDFTVKVIPSTITSLKMYVDGEEVTESTVVNIVGTATKTVIVKGKKEKQTDYVEIPYYAMAYTGGDNVSFGTSARSNVFSFENSGSATIKVALRNTELARTFKAKSSLVSVSDINISVPTTYYIDQWNPNGGEYVGLTTEPNGNGQYYSLSVVPDDASNKNVTWTSHNPDIAIFKVAHVNGFLPLKAGKASFTVTSNADASISKDVTIDFVYKNKATSVSIDKDSFDLTLSGGSIELPITYTSDTGKAVTEQRMDWSYSQEGIVSADSAISTTIEPGVGSIKHIKHTLIPLKEGTVTVTGTPWDTTGGAQPITFTVTVTKGNYVATDPQKLMTAGITAGQNYSKEFDLNAYTDEWGIFAYMRSGGDKPTANKVAYYESIAKKLKEDPSFGKNKATDLERVILGIQAYGIDASDIGGVNLLERIYNYDNSLETMGSNDICYALLALDSNQTTIPEGANWTRQRLVNTLLKYQVSDGSFALGMPDEETTTGSVDMTAMCLTSLAPYVSETNVKNAVDNGVEYLQKSLNATAGYGNSNSDSVVLTALSALKIDPAKGDAGFTVGVNNLLTSLDSYRVGSDGFKWQLTDKAVNGMATVQALYAWNAYQRFLAGDKALYDFTDMKIVSYQEFLKANETEINTTKAKERFAKCKFSLSYSVIGYTGKNCTPVVTVTYNGTRLRNGTNYTVVYKNNRSAGTASVVITGKGDYSGTKTLTFTIVKLPKKQTVKSLKASKGAFTVKWTKNNSATGYEIMYAKNSKFKKGVRTTTVKNKKTTSKKVSKLSKRCKYYVRIRSYQTVKGVKIYGSWSKYKKVTTK